MKITQSRLLYSWIIVSILCIGVLLYQGFNRNIKFDANILNLLNIGDHAGLLTKTASEPFQNKALLLFQLSSAQSSKHYLHQLAPALTELSSIMSFSFKPSDQLDIKKLITTYSDYPLALLSDEALDAKAKDDYVFIIKRYMQQLSQPSNPLVSLSIQQAPLLNIADWFASRLQQASWQQDEAFLYVERDGLRYYPVFIEFHPSAIQLDQVVTTVQNLEQLLAQTHSDEPVTVIKSGLVFHSAAVTARAQFEMQLFSALSIIGVMLLTFFSFRSLRPLLCILLLISTSMLAGMTALTLVFAQIHLLSLVFAISLVGIAVDYGYHILFAAKYTGLRGLALTKHIAPALLMGAGTTLLSYLLLLLLPIPLLQQVAVFVGAGLLFAIFTGLSIITYWSTNVTVDNTSLESVIAPRQGFRLLSGLLLLTVLAALPQWHFEDNINIFNSTPQDLINDEIRLSQLVGNQQYPRFISVSGEDQEQVLQRFERTRQVLQSLTASAYELRGLDQWLPSVAMQKANTDWLQAGIKQQKLSPIIDMINPISVEKLLSNSTDRLTETQLPQFIRQMYPEFIQQDGQTVGILSYMGPLDANLLTQVQQQLDFSINYYDQPAQYSAALSKLRHYILYFLAMAVCALLVLMVGRYRVKTGLILAAIPSLIAFSALAITQLIVGYVTIFNLLACILILALSVDYVVFLKEHGRLNYVLKSIFLSAATSALAFGIMVFSLTPAIWQFGLTVLLGVTLAWWLCNLIPPAFLNQGENKV